MASDYEAIRKDHIRRYGDDVGDFGGILVDLYPDRTQFLLELLQNAQDARATRVRLDLHADRLEVRHNGRPFTTADVIGICGIKRSTKAEDPDQIGRFGIGFKSVYAYTSRPTVHCGDEHFEIRDYVRPHGVDPVDPGSGWSTLEILPFDRSEVTAEKAVEEISGRLERLSGRTILFLRNLTELEWFAPDGRSELMCRETKPDRSSRRVSLLSGANAESVEEWLVFDRSVHLADGIDPGTVEIAFALTRDHDGTELITAADDTELVAFFPTRRETHVGFLIQGPFVPTAARDNVRDDHPLNRQLVAEVAGLTVDALQAIKEMGLLAVSTLETLPLEVAKFSPQQLLRPLYDAVRTALTDRPLLPTADGRHLAAARTRLARGTGLRELFSPKQLGELLEADAEIAWLDSGISNDRTPALHRYLVGHKPPHAWGANQEVPALLAGMELTPDAIARRLEPSFLTRQSTDWIISLYEWLAQQIALLSLLRAKAVIRRSDGEYVPAFAGGKPQMWLPPEGETSFPVVDRVIAANPEAHAFLSRLGLTQPDIADEVMTLVLPRYQRGSKKPAPDQYSSDLDRIAAALTSATGAKLTALQMELGRTWFLRAYNPATNKQYWCNPSQPYEPSRDLEVFMEGNEDVYFLTEPSLRHIDLWRGLGVKSDIEVKRREPDRSRNRYVTVTSQFGWHERGLHGFDPDFEIVGLEHALQTPTLERSVLIWNLVASVGAPLFGEVERSRRQEYSGSSITPASSPVGDLLSEHTWLLDLHGNWRGPHEVSLDDLDASYPRDEELARRLDMRPTTAREIVDGVADLFGIGSDDVDLIRRRPELLQNFLAQTREREQGANVEEAGDLDQDEVQDDDSDNGPIDVGEAIFDAFNREGATDLEEFTGDGAAANPARREERSAAALADAKVAEPARADRFKFLPRKVWEPKDPAVRAYLVSAYGGRCQICQTTFPRRDGQPYFEARYIVSRTERRWLDTPANSLCLCPTCLAKTLHGASHAAKILDDLRELAEDAKNRPDGGSVDFVLCGEPVSMRFAERHLIDLGALLKAESAEL